MAAGSKFSLNAILTLTDDMTRPYKKTTKKIVGLNDRLGRSFQSLNRGINRGFRVAAGAGIAALGAGVVIATREFIALDDSITQAGAKFKDLDVTSSTYKDTLKELSNAAREVGKVTEFSAVDSAGALDKFAMAGFTSSQAMALLMGTTNLATAANTDLTTAVDIATDSLGAFNLVVDDEIQLAENLARVSDVMAKTTTTANTSLEEMFESVKAGAPAFTAAGQSVESFAALTGIMANAGVKGSTAGTNLRNVMLRLAKPVKEAQIVLDELGVKTQDDAGNFRDIVDILGDFEKGLDGMGSAQKTAALATVFGARAVTGVNILLAEGSNNIREYREELENAGGSAETMAGAMRQSLGNQIKVIKSGLTELGLQFVESFEVDGKNALSALTEGIQNFDMKPIIDGAQKGVEIIREWGPVLLDLGPAIMGAVIAIKAMNLAMSASPIGLFVTATVALLAGMDQLEKKFGFGQSIVDESGGGIFSKEFEENRRKRFAESERGQARTAEREAGFSDPRLNVGAEQQTAERQSEALKKEETRNDIFLTAPSGYGMSYTPGGVPESKLRLGEQ